MLILCGRRTIQDRQRTFRLTVRYIDFGSDPGPQQQVGFVDWLAETTEYGFRYFREACQQAFTGHQDQVALLLGPVCRLARQLQVCIRRRLMLIPGCKLFGSIGGGKVGRTLLRCCCAACQSCQYD